MRFNIAVYFVFIILLAACEEKAIVTKPPVRALKTMVLEQRAGNQIRRISGVTEASIVTDLAFRVGGRVQEMTIDVGDEVKRGDFIAEIDTEPYQLAIQSALGQKNEARARFTDSDSKLAQLEPVFKKGYISRSDYDTATSNSDSARSALAVAESRLALARRDLKNTRLTAPLDGRVTETYIDKFAEVSPGQSIVRISSEGKLKVKANISERLVNQLHVGDSVIVTFPSLRTGGALGEPDKEYEAHITEIAGSAVAGSTFPVNMIMEAEDEQLKPGISAEVSFFFSTQATGRALLLPMTAVLATGQKGQGKVYIYDIDAQVVRERMILVLNVSDNELEVSGDIESGDIVATAGVSFLHDGMKVILLDPTQVSESQLIKSQTGDAEDGRE